MLNQSGDIISNMNQNKKDNKNDEDNDHKLPVQEKKQVNEKKKVDEESQSNYPTDMENQPKKKRQRQIQFRLSNIPERS